MSSHSRSSTDPRRLRLELAAAFGWRRPPAPERIAEARSFSDEADEARAWLSGRAWRDLNSDNVGLEHRDLLSFLSPEAWLYVFPALAAVGLDVEHPAEMADTLALSLALDGRRFVSRMTEGEIGVVGQVLEYWAQALDQRSGEGQEARAALHQLRRSERREPQPEITSVDLQSVRTEVLARLRAEFGKRSRPELLGPQEHRELWEPTFATASLEELEQGAFGPGDWVGVPLLNGEAWAYFFPALAARVLVPHPSIPLLDALLIKPAFLPVELAPSLDDAERRALILFLRYWVDATRAGIYDRETPRYALQTFWDPPEDQSS